ncbi:hypothetical protein HMPREF9071_1087 [Capnocytophaga sp. oral taxon 338 str. F0234]|nr:hypothetical protein HMPREF9071_1087 [Capnocytophaga sp. oral taxon 338 str. F0234]
MQIYKDFAGMKVICQIIFYTFAIANKKKLNGNRNSNFTY